MKKSTFLVGVISAFLILVGVAFKTQHWPGASYMMVLGGALFAFVYSIMLFIDKNKFAQSSLQKTVNLVTMLAMLIIMVSFVFKTQHWPGAGIAVIVGNLLLLVMIPVLFIHASKETEPVKKLNLNNLAIMFVILTAFSFFIWLVMSRS